MAGVNCLLLTLFGRSELLDYKRSCKHHDSPQESTRPTGASPFRDEDIRMADPAHDKELKNALSQIEKQFGKGAIMQLGENSVADVPGISTGALSLDIALGGKGLPRGRIIEIFGPEAGGKTTVALHTVAEAQKGGGVAPFIDVEHALDPGWAKRPGGDLEGRVLSHP